MVPGVDAFGSKVKSALDENDSSRHGSSTSGFASRCHNRVEFFAPDLRGDPNSSETVDFYDLGCKKLARDRIRIWTMTGAGSETVRSTVAIYDVNGGPRVGVRTETSHISKATFGKFGYPDLSRGYVRDTRGSFDVDRRASTAQWASEFVDAPVESASVGIYEFCMDSAGFENAGSTAESSYGWHGGTSSESPSRIVTNSDGTLTYSSVHEGKTETSGFDGIDITAATPNAACPIKTPEYGLSGGDGVGAYEIPLKARFDNFHLVGVETDGATVGDGISLDVSTTADRNGSLHVLGIFQRDGKLLGRFVVNEVGVGGVHFYDGETYRIFDWSVVR